MGLLFCIRDDKDISYFKELMISFTKVCRPESGLLGTGYISEYVDISGNEHFISREKNLFGVNLVKSFPDNFDLTIIGIHSKKTTSKTASGKTIDWYANYERLVKNICMRAKPIRVKACYDKSGRWHAKLFFLLKNDRPIVGIIGSSNLTEPAFASPYDNFNIEADIVLWTDEYEDDAKKIIEKLGKRINSIYGEDDRKMSGLISATFNPMWDGDSVLGRLDKMYEKIASMLPNNLIISTSDKININHFN